jgi:hypothetical protein
MSGWSNWSNWAGAIGGYLHRRSLGAGLPGQGSDQALIPTVNDFSSGNILASAVTVLPGISDTCAQWAVFELRAVPSGSEAVIVQGGLPIGTHGEFRIIVTATAIVTQILNTSAAYVAQSYTHNSVLGFYGVAAKQADDVLSLHIQGVKQGSGTASPGEDIQASTASSLTDVGHRFTSAQFAADLSIHGVGGVNGSVPSDTDITNWYTACEASNGIADMPGVTESHRWSMQDYLAVGSEWPDQVSGAILTKTGTLTLANRPAVWAP